MVLERLRILYHRYRLNGLWIAMMVQLGMLCMVTQVTAVRELMGLFYGNELVIGIVLAEWMILTALGSMAGRFAARLKRRELWLMAGMMSLTVLPLITLFWTDFISGHLMTYGVMADLDEIMLITLASLFPFCFLSGLVFVLAAAEASEKLQGNLTGYLYSWESAGSAAGSLVFSTILIYFLPATRLLTVMLVTCMFLMHPFVKPIFGRGVRFVFYTCMSGLLIYLLSGDHDLERRQRTFQNQQVAYYRDTPYGNITVTDQDGQRNYYENRVWMGSSGDVQANEETVHFAMIQHHAPKRVLVTGGGMMGILDEALKYHPDQIDYIAVNPWWLKDTSLYHASFFHPAVNLIFDEPRSYIRDSDAKYDVIILNVPEPSAAASNRFYTAEFMQELARCLAEGGVVSIGLPSSADYMSGQKRKVHSVIVRTVQSRFSHVLILPGIKDHILVSERPLRDDVTRRIDELGIQTRIVNKYYIDDDRLRERSRLVHSSLDADSPLNYDFRPLAYLEQIRLWLSSSDYRHWVFIAALSAVLLLVVIHADPVSMGLWTAGCTGASLEVLAMISCQILFADIYFMLGLLITVFMTGLAAGSRWMEVYGKFITKRNFIIMLAALGALSVITVGIIMLLSQWMPDRMFIYIIILGAVLAVSALTGMIFTCAARVSTGPVEKSASALYGMDLIGSGTGVLGVTVFVFPLWGMMSAGWILAAMNGLAAAAVYLSMKKRRPDGTGKK